MVGYILHKLFSHFYTCKSCNWMLYLCNNIDDWVKPKKTHVIFNPGCFLFVYKLAHKHVYKLFTNCHHAKNILWTFINSLTWMQFVYAYRIFFKYTYRYTVVYKHVYCIHFTLSIVPVGIRVYCVYDKEHSPTYTYTRLWKYTSAYS